MIGIAGGVGNTLPAQNVLQMQAGTAPFALQTRRQGANRPENPWQ